MKTYGSDPPYLFPLQIRTAYADLLNRLQDLQASHAMAALSSCGLLVKRVRGAEYVYAQGRTADGSSRQIYLAPYDNAGRELLEQSFDLQAVLDKLDPESLEEAFDAAKEKGPGWRTRLDAGRKAISPPRSPRRNSP
jgi:hypothetical protein